MKHPQALRRTEYTGWEELKTEELVAEPSKSFEDVYQVQTARILELEAERDKLRAFARAMFALADWPDGGDIEGCDFQDTAAEHGLLTPEERTTPCADNCWCAGFHGDCETVTCYRKAEWLLEKE